MRGALRLNPKDCEYLGIIPAYAGSTMDGTEVGVTDGDHPRVCGEHGFVAA